MDGDRSRRKWDWTLVNDRSRDLYAEARGLMGIKDSDQLYS